MKKIGLVGGMSPESTIEYYKILVREYNKRKGGVSSPEVALESVNLQQISEWMECGAWDKIYKRILRSIENLSKIGAEVIIIASNTPHKIFNRLSHSVDVPMISIMDATAEAVTSAGLHKVALLGTKFTMQSDFYPKTFARYDLTLITPSQADQIYINQVIWEELVHHILRQESREGYLNVIERLRKKGAEGVVLGCTEISLLITQEDCPIPVFDTTKLHAMATLQFALHEA
ncbi:MAG: aspartate/glutamate racemase family protein [Candidatus Korarchaeota archaeon]|nr:aspartate/glutamate racemase family protein [Candidatus Korarchaeota archaeon]NIU82245.1 amino acid racemase [Candidatus Thorarchaeota archaeon]NIW15586.1 amino acid racemase [Candidatus Thorarchaeota archaeon]